jgi:hypothetical protein
MKRFALKQQHLWPIGDNANRGLTREQQHQDLCTLCEEIFIAYVH